MLLADDKFERTISLQNGYEFLLLRLTESLRLQKREVNGIFDIVVPGAKVVGSVELRSMGDSPPGRT